MENLKLNIYQADLGNTRHQKTILSLMNAYALDLPGYEKELPEEVLTDIIPGIKKIPTALILIADINDIPSGMVICFKGFSTFSAKPVLNIHDIMVTKEHQGKGIGQKIMQAVENKARELKCSKITLEVQEKNTAAVRVYEKCGFTNSVLDESQGRSLFYTKKI